MCWRHLTIDNKSFVSFARSFQSPAQPRSKLFSHYLPSLAPTFILQFIAVGFSSTCLHWTDINCWSCIRICEQPFKRYIIHCVGILWSYSPSVKLSVCQWTWLSHCVKHSLLLLIHILVELLKTLYMEMQIFCLACWHWRADVKSRLLNAVNC